MASKRGGGTYGWPTGGGGKVTKKKTVRKKAGRKTSRGTRRGGM